MGISQFTASGSEAQIKLGLAIGIGSEGKKGAEPLTCGGCTNYRQLV